MHGMPHSRTLTKSKISAAGRQQVLLDSPLSRSECSTFLDERLELLFANNATLLETSVLPLRVLPTFTEIDPSALDVSSLTKLYLEAESERRPLDNSLR